MPLQPDLGFVPDQASSDPGFVPDAPAIGFVPDAAAPDLSNFKASASDVPNQPSMFSSGLPTGTPATDNPDWNLIRAVTSDADAGVKKVGAGMKFAGDAAYAGAADLLNNLSGRTLRENEIAQNSPDQAQPTSIRALVAAQPLPAETESESLPPALQLMDAVPRGLIKMTPQLAAVAGFEALGVPAPISAGAVFGTTENGFDAKQAAIAAAIPYVSKYSGAITAKLAEKFGISSEQALKIYTASGGAAGATTFIEIGRAAGRGRG